MYLDNRYLFMGYKILFILLCCWGLYLNSGLPQGQIRWSVLVYYTILSNIICLIYFAGSVISNVRRLNNGLGVRTYAPRMKGAVMFCIIVTMLIYNFILAPVQFSMGGTAWVYSAGNLLVHYIIPTMVVLDWLLFDPKGAFGWYDPLLWLLIPYGYFLFTVVRAQIGGPVAPSGSQYPYAFINIDQLGWGQVLLNIGRLTLIFLFLAYLIVLADRLLRKLALKRGAIR